MKQNRTKEQPATDIPTTNNYYDNTTNNSSSHCREHGSSNNGWTEIVPSSNTSLNSSSRNSSSHQLNHLSNSEDWDLDLVSSKTTTSSEHVNELKTRNVGLIGSSLPKDSSSWGGIPASEDWDLDPRTNEVDSTMRPSAEQTNSGTGVIGSEVKLNKAVKNLFSNSDPPPSQSTTNTNEPPTVVSSNKANNEPSSWGASLTGSSWDTSVKQWETSSDHSKASANDEQRTSYSNAAVTIGNTSVESKNVRDNSQGRRTTNATDAFPAAVGSKNSVTTSNTHLLNRSVLENTSSVKEHVRTGSPGITSWAGLDSFDAGITTSGYNENTNNNPLQQQPKPVSGTKPKQNANPSSFNSKTQSHGSKEHLTNGNLQPALVSSSSSKNALSSVNNRVDTNSKVSGWLQSSSPSTETWGGESQSKGNDEEFGWTTVAKPSKVGFCLFVLEYFRRKSVHFLCKVVCCLEAVYCFFLLSISLYFTIKRYIKIDLIRII